MSAESATSGGRAPTLTSVVIPALNAADTLEEQFEALANQDFEGQWELVLSDNGSTDDTRTMAESWADRLPIRVVDASHAPGFSVAANTGAKAAKGDFLAFCDSDDVVTPGWLRAFVEAAPRADVLGGRNNPEPLNSAVVQSWRGRPADGLPDALGFGPEAPAGNMGIWASRFEEIGGFPEGLLGIQDTVLSIRAHRAGYTILYVPEAELYYRHRDTIGGLWRQLYLRSFYTQRLVRELGDELDASAGASMPRRLFWLITRLPYLAMSERRRGIWVREAADVWGSLVGRVYWWYRKPEDLLDVGALAG